MSSDAPFLAQPYEYVVLHVCKYLDGLNRKCNHNCIFCFENVDLEKSNKFLPTIEMINKVLVDIKQHNRKYGVTKLTKVYVAGGEPTLREDIFDIIKLVAQTSDMVFLSSHADYEYPEIVIPKLKQAGITHLSISLHGPDAETHEAATRTPGSFNRTLCAINTCLRENIKVSLNCVVTSLNIHKIVATLEMLNKQCAHISEITFTHYRYSGIACEQGVLNFDCFCYSAVINAALDFANTLPFSIYFRDFPLCLDSRLINYNLDVAPYYVIIWNEPDFFELISERSSKTYLPMCTDCNLSKQCSGVLAANFNKYDKYTAWSKLGEQ